MPVFQMLFMAVLISSAVHRAEDQVDAPAAQFDPDSSEDWYHAHQKDQFRRMSQKLEYDLRLVQRKALANSSGRFKKQVTGPKTSPSLWFIFFLMLAGAYRLVIMILSGSQEPMFEPTSSSEPLCPRCGYNVTGQILAGIRRCSECGGYLPAFDVKPQAVPVRSHDGGILDLTDLGRDVGRLAAGAIAHPVILDGVTVKLMLDTDADAYRGSFPNMFRAIK